MSENPFENQGRVGMRLDKSAYAVMPAGNTTITITLRNQGLEDDNFALAIGGVPAAWVSATQPVVSLAPGEEKETSLVIQAPILGEVETGERNLTIRAASKQHPEQFTDVKTVLVVKMEDVLARVSVEMESAQFAVAPGSSTLFTLKLTNNGLATETLRLFVDGIPTGWVSTPSPITELAPGETKDIPITIAPPRDSKSRAGRHPITIRLVSQQNPELAVLQECILTIGAYTQFESQLLPAPPLAAQQNAQINVSNAGNIQEAFKLSWQSEDDLLAFELWQKEGENVVFKEIQEYALKVESGKKETAYFRTGLRQRPLLGGSKTYPFQVQVQTSGDEVMTHNSEVKDRGVIPLWVIPLVLVLCVSVVCVGVFLYNWLQDDAPPPVAGDDSWARVQEAGVLKVATAADYPPFSYHNDDFAIDGFDPALIREIGTKLGVQVEISDYAFEGLAAALNVQQADLVIAAVSVSPAREAEFDFSNIYYVSDDGILAHTDSGIEQITTPADLAGKRIGVQKFSIYENWAVDVLIADGIITQDQLFAFAKPEHAIDDLKHQRLDLVIMDLQPATQALADGDLKLVGQGLNPQRLAIAFPTGADTLRSKVNEALLALQNEGRINQLAQTYLGLNPEDIIPPPTPEPTPESTATATITPTEDPNTPTPTPCIDAMAFVKDLNYDDGDLSDLPEVDPGTAFQKGWRFRNSGSCTWTGSYFIKYSHGNDAAAQMGGQPTSVQGEVKPGEEYDIYVDLVAPDASGEYVGYWQMHNAESEAFGQTVWVAIEVPNLDPELPTATVTPETTPTPTEGPPPEPTATDIPAEPTETPVPIEPTATAAPGDDLRDTTWLLEGLLFEIDDEDLTDPIPDVELTLIFNEDGTLEGNAGCNTYRGRYVTDGKQLVLQEIVIGRTSCEQPEGIMKQESLFVELLEDIEEYRFNEDEMLEFTREIIEDEQPVDKVILLFSDRDAPSP